MLPLAWLVAAVPLDQPQSKECTMDDLTSFKTDIRPLFTQRDIQGMSKAFNLANYDDVKTHAGAILDRIRGIGEIGRAHV